MKGSTKKSSVSATKKPMRNASILQFFQYAKVKNLAEVSSEQVESKDEAMVDDDLLRQQKLHAANALWDKTRSF